MKKVKVTKLEETENPLHPHNIMIGAVYIGTYIKDPEIGSRFNIGPISINQGERGLSTSGVQEIIDNNTFRTYNSIYHWEIIEE